MTPSVVTQSVRPHLQRQAWTQLDHMSIVIPCFNEGESIDFLYKRLNEAFGDALGAKIELVLVDDGSTDDTLPLLKEQFGDLENVQIVSDGINRGLSQAILIGIRNSQHEFVCSMDSDCTYAPEDITKILELMAADVSMVTGSPYHPDGAVFDVPRWRIAISRIASRIYRCIMKTNLHCYTSCFRIYRKSDCKNLKLDHPGYTGTVEMIWNLERQRKKVVECPVDLRPRRYGQSKIKLVPVIWRHLILMANITQQRFWRKVQWLLTR